MESTAEVIGEFEDGSPAIVINRYGKGWAMFVGTMLSAAFYLYGDSNAGKLLKGLPVMAELTLPVTVEGIDPELDIEPRLLEGKTQNGKPYSIFFAFNHTTETYQPKFGLSIEKGNYELIDVLTRQPVPFTWKNDRLYLEKSLAPSEIWVIKATQS
jgi:hypothetical protein